MLRLYDIDQMVRRTRAQVRVRLGRANIQPAIHLRRIDTDDLDVRPFSQSDRGSGFARRGWAEQTDDGQWTIFRLDHSLTASYKKLGIFQLTCKRNTIECIFQNNDQEFRTAALARRADADSTTRTARRRALPARLCGTPDDFVDFACPVTQSCLARSNRIELRDMQNRQSHQEFRTAALARRASLPYELYCLRRRALPARLCGTPSHYFGKYIL